MNFTLRRAVLLFAALAVCTVLSLGALGSPGSAADASTPVPDAAPVGVAAGTVGLADVAREPRPAATTRGGGLLGGVASIGASTGSLQLGVLPALGGGPLLDLHLPGLDVTVGKPRAGAGSGPGRPVTSPPAGHPSDPPPASVPATGRRHPTSAAGQPGRGSAAARDEGAIGEGASGASRATAPRRTGASSPLPSAQALPPPGPSVYRTLRQSFPYLAAVACAAAVLVFGFVLVVAALARRRDPIAAGAEPVRAERRRPRPRPRPAQWDYTFDASHPDELGPEVAGPVATRRGRRPFIRRP